jgi:hypothetical protein
MAYASIDDVRKRMGKAFDDTKKEMCEAMLDDAATIIDAYNKKASEDAKKIVSCNMVIRVISCGDTDGPIGSTQGTASALGYSQTWTLGTGSIGELYLTKLDKKLLGANCKIGFLSPYEQEGSND